VDEIQLIIHTLSQSCHYSVFVVDWCFWTTDQGTDW